MLYLRASWKIDLVKWVLSLNKVFIIIIIIIIIIIYVLRYRVFLNQFLCMNTC